MMNLTHAGARASAVSLRAQAGENTPRLRALKLVAGSRVPARIMESPDG